MNSKENIVVSSASFIDMSNMIGDGVKTAGAYLMNDVYAPEIPVAVDAATENNIGLELAYRVGLPDNQRLLDQLKEVPKGIQQIHGPIYKNLIDAALQGYSEKGYPSIKNAIQDYGIGLFANGTLDHDWPFVRELAQKVDSDHIVIHPYVARFLGPLNLEYRDLIIGIEPDFKRLQENPYLLWDFEQIYDIAQQNDTGIVIDVSHTAISYNSLDNIFKFYERAKNAPRGVSAIHFNAATPTDNREDFFIQGTAAMPLYRDTRDDVKKVLIEFYNHVQNDPDFKGPIVLEFWSFPHGNSMQQRKDAVKETLDVLYKG